MDESEWAAGTDPKGMLEFLRGKVSEWKLRLFAVACCRQLQLSLTERQGWAAVEIAEHYADNPAVEHERDALARDAQRAHQEACYFLDVFLGAVLTAGPNPTEAARWAVAFDWSGYRESEWRPLVPLLRHIFGNPFRPCFPCDAWSSTVVNLATALYNGHQCRFAFHDALLETGNSELAEHFCHDEVHPKGCWALDLILGKSWPMADQVDPDHARALRIHERSRVNDRPFLWVPLEVLGPPSAHESRGHT